MQQQQRLFLELSYNGTNYHGWQIQPNAVTVQEVLDKALSTLFRAKVETVGCGRTDTGVHASQFFAHFDLEAEDLLDQRFPQYLNSLNALLPFDIAVKRLFRVASNAHARFDATQRSYEYHIHHQKNPFKHNFSWLMKDDLDTDAMNLAASLLFQYTDFSCFSKSHTQVFTNNCKITRAEWVVTNDGLIFHVSADRFLRNMVRAIVGTLVEIGRGKAAVESIHQIIESKDRSNAGTSVPACGLYLTKIEYPYL
ncbi:tRNA pseudouridine(38-40) synthase TruA [Pedobacter sp. SYSU D00535]|uniref:tRNA pseudouridine(38-40) synthase TruA n=1 Tax=Pedobacter sp. SYSU D00535 TaxID=2810308 RepID=UPI001A95E083